MVGVEMFDYSIFGFCLLRCLICHGVVFGLSRSADRGLYDWRVITPSGTMTDCLE